MDFAVALSLVAVVIGVVVAILSRRIGAAPGWERYRALAAVGLTAALYAALDTCWSLDVSSKTRVVCLQLIGVVAALHVACWQSYVAGRLGPTGRRVDRILVGISVVLGALWLVPGLMCSDMIVRLSVPWLGVQYRFPELRWTGALAFTVQTAILGFPMARYLRVVRSGPPGARLHALALGVILLAAINDTLAAAGVIRSPLLVASGFVMAVGALGWDLTRAFVASARELDRLSRGLEQLVTERTCALVSAEAALLRTEKMAALGQLSAGVAHEINNPAAAVGANLGYLRDALARGKIPGDAIECVDESLEGVERITKIVAQLLDSGRAAARARSDGGSAVVLRAVQQALASSKTRIGAHVTTSFDVPPDLVARADESSLVQVLVNLIVNAAQAILPNAQPGRIVIRAAAIDGRIAIDVVDNGAGMSDETKRRLFEPFFTTKAQGEGTGLGLSVSLGLLRAMGGDLSLSSSAAGTSMRIDLDRGQSARVVAARAHPRPAIRHRLLIVDDDHGLARALTRSLGSTLDVTLASGVADAREKLAQAAFDVVLCDVQMPDGGGRRVYEELAARSPELARRVILFSGGPPSEADRMFFEASNITLLQKPLAHGALLEAAERIWS